VGIRTRGGISACLVAGAGLGLILLAGCGKTPKGQVVAIVNGNDISMQQLSVEAQDLPLPIPETIDRRALSKAILQAVIDRELEVQAAREQRLDKTPQFLALKQRNEEELLAGMLGHKIAQTVPLPTAEEIRNYVVTHPLQFGQRQRLVLDQLGFAPPGDRRRLAAVLTDAHSLDAAAAALRSIGIAAERGQGAIDTGQADPELARQLDRAPAGEPILLPQGDRLVVGVITAREPIRMSSDDIRIAAARAVRAAALLHESQAQIAAARSTAEISYGPGFAPDKPPAARR
jgi:EpsD family peptidyl-prolyl cis-trans isomerase